MSDINPWMSGINRRMSDINPRMSGINPCISGDPCDLPLEYESLVTRHIFWTFCSLLSGEFFFFNQPNSFGATFIC